MWFRSAEVTAPLSAPWESKAACSRGFGLQRGLEGIPVTWQYRSFISGIQNKTIRFLGKKKIPHMPGIFSEPFAARAFC